LELYNVFIEIHLKMLTFTVDQSFTATKQITLAFQI